MFLVARLRRLAPTTWLTAAVLVLLPLLAVLQYRWLSQVGADAGSRMQAVAANAARALSRDLAFEVNRAWLERAGGQAPPAAEATGSGAPLVVDALVISLDRRGAGGARPPPLEPRHPHLRTLRLASRLRRDPRRGA